MLYYNVGGIQRRKPGFYTNMLKLDPCIFCFAETWHTKTQTNTFYSNYKIIENFGIKEKGPGRPRLGYIMGIRSKLDFSEEYRDDLCCIIMSGDFMIIFAYIPPDEDFKINHSRVMNKVKMYQGKNLSKKLILMGDMNSRIGTNQTRDLLSLEHNEYTDRNSKDRLCNTNGKLFLRKANDLNLRIVNGTCSGDREGEFTFVNHMGASAIDLCLVGRQFLKKEYDFAVLDLHYSDHFPILFSVKLCEPRLEVTKSTSKIVWDRSKYEEFCLQIQADVSEAGVPEPVTICQIIKQICAAAEQVGMLRKRKLTGNKIVKGPVWFNSKCLEAKTNLGRARRTLRRAKAKHFNIKEHLQVFIREKKTYSSVLLNTENDFYLDIQSKLNNAKDASQFYKALSLYRNKKGASLNKVQVPIKVFESFFKQVFSVEIEPCADTVNKQLPFIEVEELDKEFILDELDEALKKISRNKAPGNDGIPNEVWKALPDINKIQLLNTFNCLFETNDFPDNWAEIVICPLFKKNDPALPENYRPISLANTVLKLYTQLLSNRILSWSARNHIISDYQAAYKWNSGCADHVFVLTAALQYNIHKGRPIHALFVDMSQAFDTINHERLWIKLNKQGLSTKVINTLKAIYSRANARVRTNYDISGAFKIEKGVLQGETVSPILWNMYLEDLIGILDNSDTMPVRIMQRAIHALLYADDIILLAYTEGELQKKIAILRKYLLENGLRVNLSKTKCMVFSKGLIKSTRVLKWQDELIERVSSYVYLGVPFSENMNFRKAKNLFFRKAELAINDLRGLIYKSRMNNLDSIMALYNSLVRSILMYCAPVWGLKFRNEFEKLRMKFLKCLFLIPRTTPDWIVRLELDLRDSRIFFLKTCLQFWMRLRDKKENSLVFNAYQSVRTGDNGEPLGIYKELHNFCKDLDCSHLLDFESVGPELDLSGIDRELYADRIASIVRLSKMRVIRESLEKLNGDSVSWDILEMNDTKLYVNYKQNKTHCIKEEYLSKYNLKWEAKILVLQLKLGISHVTHKGKCCRLRKLEYLYGKVEDKLCNLCGRAEEDIFHILIECCHYAGPRRQHLSELLSDTIPSRYNYLKMFNNLSENSISNLSKFFLIAFKLRMLHYSEMGIELG
jgi:hypothetical protein